MQPEDAMTIYQEYLDRMGEAALAFDAETFLARIFLPHIIETEDLTIVIENIETARKHFHGFANALASQRVDDYTRVARSAVFDTPDQLKGHHRTFMTSAGKLVVPAFDNEVTLIRRDGVWGSIGTRHHARYVSWPDILPRPAP